MLKSFTLKNFKSFKEATLPLTPTVTFLIGANGSGKTNALEALQLLKWLSQRRSLEDLANNINSSSSIIRGPIYELFQYGKKSFDINTIIEIDGEKDDERDEYDFSLSIKMQEKNKGNVTTNIPFISTEILNKVKLEKNDIIFRINDNSIGDNSIKIPFKTEKRENVFFSDFPLMSLFIAVAGAKNKKKIDVQKMQFGAQILKDHFSSIFFLEPEIKGMRGYVKQFAKMSLSENGDNLSAVLEELCRDKKVKKGILDIVRSLPEQEIIDINFSKTDENFMMVKLEESFSKKHHKTPAYSLSDGTLRVLAIATALYSVPEGSLIVIEEVDNGIHPRRIQHLVNKMYEIAAERKIQILVTTHDPAMMNAIPPQEKGNVLCCYRSKEDGTSKILRLSDSPHADSIIIGQKLGDTVTTEQFDSQIKDTRSAQEVHEDQMKWLEQFMQSVSNFDKEEADE